MEYLRMKISLIRGKMVSTILLQNAIQMKAGREILIRSRNLGLDNPYASLMKQLSPRR